MREMSHLFGSDPTGFMESAGAAAVAMRFENWISTPKGTFWGRPSWGHTLRKFLHEPPTDTLAMVMEAEIVATLAKDIPEVEIEYVRSKPSDLEDGYALSIGYSVPSEGIRGEYDTQFSVGG